MLLKKFFIITISGYDIWTFFDEPYRFNPNNTLYNNIYNYYILDYEYFEIMQDIYYNHVFLDPNLEFIFYIDYLAETRNAEDDDHELYRVLSNYVIPLHYKFYVLEHYWPADERGSFIFYENFYDFNDLIYEFKFINEDFFPLWAIYEKEIHSRTIFVNENLFENEFIQFYYFNLKNKNYNKEILNELYYKSNRNIFIKKEIRYFNGIKPDEKLKNTNYMTWFLLDDNYKLDKYEYNIFYNLPVYELFDKKYYDLYLDFYKNLIDVKTNYKQFIETKDEYFNDFINNNNLLNYYFESGVIFNFIQNILNLPEFEIFDQTFDYLYINFNIRILVLYFYVIYLYKFFIFIFILYSCWFSLNYFDYSFNFDLHLSYIRSLVRFNYLNNYNDYKDLIFNYYYNISDNNNLLYVQNKNLINNLACDRDRLKFPDKFSF